MALPTLITVHGKFTKPDGSPEQGIITFKSSVYSLDSGSDTVLVPGVVPGYLDSTGTISITLPATNDPEWTPSGWTYTLIAQFTSAFYSYEVVIPYDAPNKSLSFTSLVPASSSSNNQLYAAYNHTHAGFLTEANIGPAVEEAVAVSLEDYATDADLALKADKTELSSYVTLAQLSAKVDPEDLASVAFTGDYVDLINKPVIGDSAVSSVAGKTGDVTLTKSDVGLSNVDNTSDLSKPISTATQTALNTKANTSSLAAVATSGSYIDLSNKPTIPTVPVTSVAAKTGDVLLVKADVGLANVDNTSDANKPVSSATQTALNGKAATLHTHTQSQITDLDFPVDSVAGKTGTVTLTKSDVGLANVDNTSDASKPISTATQTALNGKSNTGHAHVQADITDLSFPVTSVASKTGAVTLVKADVGLSDVDNTSDISKPISTATQTALDGKAASVHTHTQSQITDLTFPVTSVASKTGAVTLTKSDVGLANVDNTSDANKPVSTATSTALSGKVDKSTLTTKGDLFVADASGVVSRLALGTNAQVLTVDTTVGQGVKWATASGGSGTATVVRRANITSGSYTLVSTAGAWVPIANGPTLTIPAAVGNNVECYVGCLLDCNTNATDFFELIVLGAGNTIARFASTGTSTAAGANEGDPANYPGVTGQRFRGMSVNMSFVVASGDLISGNVTFSMAHRGTGVGKVFADANYPFRWRALNFGS